MPILNLKLSTSARTHYINILLLSNDYLTNCCFTLCDSECPDVNYCKIFFYDKFLLNLFMKTLQTYLEKYISIENSNFYNKE